MFAKETAEAKALENVLQAKSAELIPFTKDQLQAFVGEPGLPMVIDSGVDVFPSVRLATCRSITDRMLLKQIEAGDAGATGAAFARKSPDEQLACIVAAVAKQFSPVSQVVEVPAVGDQLAADGQEANQDQALTSQIWFDSLLAKEMGDELFPTTPKESRLTHASLKSVVACIQWQCFAPQGLLVNQGLNVADKLFIQHEKNQVELLLHSLLNVCVVVFLGPLNKTKTCSAVLVVSSTAAYMGIKGRMQMCLVMVEGPWC